MKWPWSQSPPSDVALLRRRVEMLEQEWEDTQRRITNALRSLRMREQKLYEDLERTTAEGRGRRAGGGIVRPVPGFLGGSK